MSSASTSTFDPCEMPPEPVRRFTVDEYHQLIEIGFFGEDEAYELIEGWLVPQMTKKPPHEYALSYLDDLVAERLTGKLLRRCQLAITLADGEPEPDLAVVQGPRANYRHRHPHGDEVVFVIEISDVTLRRDRGPKLRSYARAGIPIYWIVNIPARQVEVHTVPQGAKYKDRAIFREEDTILLPLGGKRPVKFVVGDLFPDR